MAQVLAVGDAERVSLALAPKSAFLGALGAVCEVEGGKSVKAKSI